jgi:Big-like domain-containing protein/VCBS repeat protein
MFSHQTIANTILATILATSSVAALDVVSITPAGGALNQSVHSSVSVTFDQPLDQASVTASSSRFHAFGRWSGPAPGSITFSPDGRTAILNPTDPFFPGEQVFIVIANTITDDKGDPLRAAGYSFSFWTHARRAPMQFTAIDTISTRTVPGQATQAYGGIASDLNNDGFSDLTIVQEITADLRVFLNRADHTGLFNDFTQPTFPVGNRASPSEPADFNMDGEIDICVANIDDDTVSVLFGNGDGTFTRSQTLPAGDGPRGIAVLDFDGDGDLDIANTNANSSDYSLFTNRGDGTFSSARFFEAGGNAEWSMAAADMTEDGITDLIIGARNSARVIVLAGNGDGTFDFVSSTPCGGSTWIIVFGDVNGDGHQDIASINSFSSNVGILLGDGSGQLTLDNTYSSGAFSIATDLGDLDGDGDLDLTTSSFSSSNWRIYTNDGSGRFTPVETVDAPNAGSCTLVHDFDNDGDNDLSLIDEIADVVILYENSGKAIDDDFDGNGVVNLADFADFDACINAEILTPDCEVFDTNNDQVITFADFRRFQTSFSP